MLKKRGIALLVMLAMLLAMLPLSVMAAETGSGHVVAPPMVSEWIVVNGHPVIRGQTPLYSAPNVAVEYPNNAPSYVDTANEKAAWIAAQCRSKGITDPWEIALWLHDWLIYNADYDNTLTRYTADGVLLEGTGVCDSYTRAYNLLLKEFGFECIRLSSDEMNHAWNLVKIDGQWCHIDVTWDDPIGGGFENHGYFGLTDARMDLDHDWDDTDPDYPPCTSDINYYPIRMGLGFTNEQEMKALLTKYADERVETIELTYLGDDPDFPSYYVFNDWYQTAYWKYRFLECACIIDGNKFTMLATYPETSGGGHTHSYHPVVTEPECMIDGYTTYICDCGNSYTADYVSAKGHKWVEATCTEPKTCATCGETEGKELGHSWKDATCTEAKTCKTCGETSGKALGHSWKDATCTDPKTCKTCGATSDKALDHNWKAATCTDPKTCKTCGATSGKALGHSWKAATCTDPKTCKTCGATSGKALGHSWENATCTDPKTCKTCGETSGKALDHNWKAATCTEAKLARLAALPPVRLWATAGRPLPALIPRPARLAALPPVRLWVTIGRPQLVPSRKPVRPAAKQKVRNWVTAGKTLPAPILRLVRPAA